MWKNASVGSMKGRILMFSTVSSKLKSTPGAWSDPTQSIFNFFFLTHGWVLEPLSYPPSFKTQHVVSGWMRCSDGCWISFWQASVSQISHGNTCNLNLQLLKLVPAGCRLVRWSCTGWSFCKWAYCADIIKWVNLSHTVSFRRLLRTPGVYQTQAPGHRCLHVGWSP